MITLSRTWPAVLAISIILGMAGSAWAGCVPRYKNGELRSCQGGSTQEDYSECGRGDGESCRYLERVLADKEVNPITGAEVPGTRKELSPLIKAALWGQVAEARRLLDSNPGAESPAPEAVEALFVAVRVGHEKVVRLLLTRKVPASSADQHGNTALGLAASAEHVSIVRTLLDAGADPNAQGWRMDGTALMSAAFAGNLPLAKLLLGRGADPNIQAKNTGNFALIGAASKGNLELIRLLLKHGADPSLKNTAGKTAADIARNSNELKAAQLLESAQKQ